MCSDFVATAASTIAANTITRLLSKSERNLFEIKHVVINGTSDTIHFIIHFIKGKVNQNIIKRKLVNIFTKKEIHSFEKDFEIKITDNFGNDVTRDIIEYGIAKKTIVFDKFFDLQGREFIIEARGRYREKYRELFLLDHGKEPIFKTEHKIGYKTKIVVFNKKYDAEVLNFINIPFTVFYPMDFIGSRLLKPFDVKAYRHLNSVSKTSSTYRKRRKQLHQKWGFDPEDLDVKISAFLRVLEDFVQRRFREIIIATSEKHNVQITKVVIEFNRVQAGLPNMVIRPTICFDYSQNDENAFEISVLLKKDTLLKFVDKLWSKFKKPKRTAPKKLKKKSRYNS